MSSSPQKFFMDESFAEKEENKTTSSKNLADFILFYSTLTTEEKVEAKKLIREAKVF